MKILGGEICLADLRARMPFKYGIATMTEMPHAFLRLAVEIDGAEQAGTSAEFLPPRWFTKDPDKRPDVEVAEMLAVVRHALAGSAGLAGPTAFAIWRALYESQSAWAGREGLPPLLAHLGTSLVERALIDATCRSAGRPFHRLLLDGALGLDLGRMHAELAGRTPADLLPAEPLPAAIARHTVGLSDPLTDADIPDAERVSDGLPQALDDCIERYGLTHFKIKVNGKLEEDLGRLGRLAEVITASAGPDFAFSLDGNEQFRKLSAFREFWESARDQARLAPFFEHLLFVEQPLHRDVALSEATGEAMLAWKDRPPTIIDESDATVESLPAALRLGYAGTSHKNCKGVFKGVANRCLIESRRRVGQPLLMSGEDLANIGPVALLQDLAVMAALGIESIERNGHHYFAGLSGLPAEVQRLTLAHHGDLYARSEAGWPTLDIRDGRIRLDSVNAAPFGCAFAPDISTLEKVQP